MNKRIINIVVVVAMVSGIMMLIRLSGPRLSFAPVEIVRIERIEVIDDGLSENNKMAELLAPYRQQASDIMSEVVGVAADTYEVGYPETPLTRLVAEMMLSEAQQTVCADVAISNIGGIRSTMYSGEVTVGDIYKILPFDNAMVVLQMRGSTLDSLATDIAVKGGAALAGMTFSVESDTTAVDVMVGCEPIDPNKIYRVVTNDYLSWGNDGFKAMSRYESATALNVMLRDAMLHYIKVNDGKIIAPTDKCIRYRVL